MTSDARDRLTKLYHAALTRAPEERSAFLKDACDGDDTLRQEVESLLRYASDNAPFVETPAMLVGSDMARSADRNPMIGRQLGPYSIVAPLGSGGMGEVYRARDADVLIFNVLTKDGDIDLWTLSMSG